MLFCNDWDPWGHLYPQLKGETLKKDNIEVRICGYDDREDTPINLLEIYLQ